jgi:hypothetical protein
MDVSAAIAEITDREQIRELTYQYCFALDGGDLRELAALFAESARLVIEYPGRPVRRFEGPQAIYEFYRGFYQRVEILRLKSKIRSSSCTAIRRSQGAIGTQLTPSPTNSARAIILTPCAVAGRGGSSKKGWRGSLIRRLWPEPGAGRQRRRSTNKPISSGAAAL